MKTLVILGVVLVVALVVLAAWAFSWASISVRDVREAETLILGQGTGNPGTWALSIRGSGQVDGEATVSLLLGEGRPYHVQRLSGKVDFEWSGDWYSETAKVRYEPVSVRSGKVVLHHRFHK